MNTPKISIIIPCYNIAGLPENIISSVTAQTYKNLEIIFVNDGSTDRTHGLLTVAAVKDPRIIIIDQKNSGSAAAARNSGLKQATGDYIMFFDADDRVDSTMTRRMLKNLILSRSDLAICGFRYHRLADNTNEIIFTSPAARHHPQESLPAYAIRLLGNDGRLNSSTNKIFRADIIKKHHLAFNSALDFGEDLIFVLDYLKHATKISFVHAPLYTYNYGTPTSTVQKSSLKLANWEQNWQYLTSWFKPKTPEETDQLNWIKYRWSYSHCLAIHRSALAPKQKLALYKQAAQAAKNLPPIGHIKYIGKGKYLQERSYRLAAKSPATLAALAKAAAKLKKATAT